MVAILHTFVTVAFKPSLIPRLITDSELYQINRIFGHQLWMIGPENFINEIVEIFIPRKIENNYCMRFIFVGYIIFLLIKII